MKCPHCDGTGELPPEDAHVGTLIMTHRKARGMTQEELANALGKSRPQIANIEAGRSSFDVRQLREYADALGVSARELIP